MIIALDHHGLSRVPVQPALSEVGDDSFKRLAWHLQLCWRLLRLAEAAVTHDDADGGSDGSLGVGQHAGFKPRRVVVCVRWLCQFAHRM